MKKTIIIALIALMSVTTVFATKLPNWEFNASTGVDFCMEGTRDYRDRYLGFPVMFGACYHSSPEAKIGTYAEIFTEFYAKKGVPGIKYTPSFGLMLGACHDATLMQNLTLNCRAGLNLYFGTVNVNMGFGSGNVKVWDLTVGIETTNCVMYHLADNLSLGGGLMMSMDFLCINGTKGAKASAIKGFYGLNVAPVANVTMKF